MKTKKRQQLQEAIRVNPSFPRFSPDAPPADWELQHNCTQRMTIFERTWGYTGYNYPGSGDPGAGYDNRAVPRLASHHYASDRVAGYTPHRDTATFVFA